MTSTPLAGERLRPLGHLSVAPLDKEKRGHNQQAGAIIAENSARAGRHLAAYGDSMAIPCLATRSWRRNFGRWSPDSTGCKALMVNENFRSEAKSCHLCNNVRG
ncbi:hypothetical protein MPLB_1740022 [Mesorhizobium sp. ORS 3324]|nr:hypothetical protein MPLB_1740022 [Mesorhizobium sp. ORS 3324]